MTMASGDPSQPRPPWWLVTWSAPAAQALLALWTVVVVCGAVLWAAGATLWIVVPLLAAGAVNAGLGALTTMYLRRQERERHMN
jgi:hypothetical protein